MNLELSSHPNLKNPSNLPSKYEFEKSKPFLAPSGSINSIQFSLNHINKNTNKFLLPPMKPKIYIVEIHLGTPVV